MAALSAAVVRLESGLLPALDAFAAAAYAAAALAAAALAAAALAARPPPTPRGMSVVPATSLVPRCYQDYRQSSLAPWGRLLEVSRPLHATHIDPSRRAARQGLVWLVGLGGWFGWFGGWFGWFGWLVWVVGLVGLGGWFGWFGKPPTRHHTQTALLQGRLHLVRSAPRTPSAQTWSPWSVRLKGFFRAASIEVSRPLSIFPMCVVTTSGSAGECDLPLPPSFPFLPLPFPFLLLFL